MTRPCEAISFVGDERGEEVAVSCTKPASMVRDTGEGMHAICSDCHYDLLDYPMIQAEYVQIEGATE